MPKGTKKANKISIEDLFLTPREKSTDSLWRRHLMQAYNVCRGANEEREDLRPIKTLADLLELQGVFSGGSAYLVDKNDGKLVRVGGVGRVVVRTIRSIITAHGFKFQIVPFKPSRPSWRKEGVRRRR